MTDLEKWWWEQKGWGFNPFVTVYSGNIHITTEEGSSNNFKGYGGFVLTAEFTVDGDIIEVGVYE